MHPLSRFSLLCASALIVSCTSPPRASSLRAPRDLYWSQRLPDPVSAGTTFESPVIESNLEAHVVDHTFPDDSIFQGGGYNVYALQARFAVNDQLAIIATKDGYIDLQPDAGSEEDGLADIAGGVKYMLYEDPESGVLVTPGLIFETTAGDEEVFQGNGDGLIRAFVSAGWDKDQLNVISSVGYNQPLDGDEETSSIDYHLHVSYEVTPEFLPLLEINGITYTSDGEALDVNFEGGDLINLGSTDVSGNTVISGAIGAAYRPSDDWQVGLTYETPWTSREDLMDSRLWFAVLWRF